jgi:succinate dehydrogenase/fumarate reductase flavoprotein subunit
LIQKHAPLWPYQVNYGKENEVNCDVLVLGGGIAGCWAAIHASRKGAKVVMVEKGFTKTSGAGGSGVDHWHAAVTNPACKVGPEEFSNAVIDDNHGWRNGISQYITCRESYDCLLELEKMGAIYRAVLRQQFADGISKSSKRRRLRRPSLRSNLEIFGPVDGGTI